MTTEEREDLLNAIQEFYDHAFHPNMKPNISDKAKAVALAYMIRYWNQNNKIKIGSPELYGGTNNTEDDISLDEMIADLPDD